jgi:hypothetical protein
MDSWRGRREMQTLRKLPKARPKSTAKMATSRFVERLLESLPAYAGAVARPL